jgi:hypothetical protein
MTGGRVQSLALALPLRPITQPLPVADFHASKTPGCRPVLAQHGVMGEMVISAFVYWSHLTRVILPFGPRQLA